jgi:UDP-3-O-[3-hydroxymyristoyl] glucosamine N-acyltransferase
MIQFSLSVQEIADIVGGTVHGDASRTISGVAKIEDAEPHTITFLSSKNFERYLEGTGAGCVIVDDKRELVNVQSRSYIRCSHPHKAFVQLLESLLNQMPKPETGIHPSAVVSATANVNPTASIGPHAVIGDNATVGASTVVMSGCVLGNNVSVGEHSLLHPHVVIEDDCIVGDRCIVHAHAVIGSDGFGYLENSDGSFHKIPQVGNVVVMNDVEIGAGACIDRAALGSTVVENGVKLDNMVHLAHNVRIQTNTAIAAQSGIAGGTIIGERNRVAGQVGVVGYIQTAPNVILGAQSGVSKSITQPGVYSGSPAMELKQRLKQEAVLRRITKDA